MKRKITAWVLALALLFCLAGCGKTQAEKQGFDLSLQSGVTQMEWIKNPSNATTTLLVDLKTPVAILYYQDGKITAFVPEDDAFHEIIRLNAERDNLNRTDGKQWGSLLTAPNPIWYESYPKEDTYLLYRYPEGSYGDILFHLPTAAESAEDPNGNWIYEVSPECHSSIAHLAPADELLAYLDKVSG